ncbi:DDE-type integrase/transposase/recombinase [Streptomyces sp. NPDC006700]|uniref:DDE-type integrase/transposase/recombinase n=1 Tax=Streptomyces sp. NPDC006700 TaxID=3154479 RepID=UPI0033FF7610
MVRARTVELSWSGQRVPAIVDELRCSPKTVRRWLDASVEHRAHKGLNNRAENSHQPTRQRERAMKGFRSVGGAQRFLAPFSRISPHFRPGRHLMFAPEYRTAMKDRFIIWNTITATIGHLVHRAERPGTASTCQELKASRST